MVLNLRFALQVHTRSDSHQDGVYFICVSVFSQLYLFGCVVQGIMCHWTLNMKKLNCFVIFLSMGVHLLQLWPVDLWIFNPLTSLFQKRWPYCVSVVPCCVGQKATFSVEASFKPHPVWYWGAHTVWPPPFVHVVFVLTDPDTHSIHHSLFCGLPLFHLHPYHTLSSQPALKSVTWCCVYLRAWGRGPDLLFMLLLEPDSLIWIVWIPKEGGCKGGREKPEVASSKLGPSVFIVNKDTLDVETAAAAAAVSDEAAFSCFRIRPKQIDLDVSSRYQFLSKRTEKRILRTGWKKKPKPVDFSPPLSHRASPAVTGYTHSSISGLESEYQVLLVWSKQVRLHPNQESGIEIHCSATIQGFDPPSKALVDSYGPKTQTSSDPFLRQRPGLWDLIDPSSPDCHRWPHRYWLLNNALIEAQEWKK